MMRCSVTGSATRGRLSRDDRDSAPFAPLAAVVDPAFSWEGDRHPRTPWDRTVIYEAHVKGFTKLHPDIPPALRGTYAALATAPVIEHLQRLGVTALGLMPVHHHSYDRHLVERGLTNYRGYNTLCFFAPDLRYSAEQNALASVREFKEMVRALHAAGIEIILDVVYNHAAEGRSSTVWRRFRPASRAPPRSSEWGRSSRASFVPR